MKVLFVGPDLNPLTGQSIAFDYIVSRFNRRYCIYNSSGKTRLLQFVYFIKFFFSFFAKVLLVRPRVIYLSISRSKLGFIRDLYVFIVSYIFNKKVIVHLHGSDFRTFVENSGKLRVLIDFGYKNVHEAIVLSDEMRTQFSYYPHIKVITVKNCYSFDRSNFVPNKIGQPIKLLFLSNLMRSKGIVELLEGVSKFDTSEVELKLAGTFMGDEYLCEDAIQRKVESFLGPNIKYCGLVKGDDKEDLLNWANIIILPSYREAQPLVIIEGMAAGRYIISSGVGYIKGIIEHKKNGFIIEKINANSIYEAIRFAILNPSEIEEVSSHNESYARANFSKERYVREIFEIIGVLK